MMSIHKKNTSAKHVLFMSGVLALGTVSNAFGQTLTELTSLVQRSRSVIQNNASIDDQNPESITFTTAIGNQLVELSLRGTRLNDSFVTAINYPGTERGRGHKSLALPASSIQFGDLRIHLDGCDVTSALLAQCNSNQCWDANPSEPHADWSGSFGTAIHLNLSVLNPSAVPGCTAVPGQTSFFEANLTSHTLQFSEGVIGQGKGGTLNYQVIIFNKAYQ